MTEDEKALLAAIAKATRYLLGNVQLDHPDQYGRHHATKEAHSQLSDIVDELDKTMSANGIW